MPNSSETSLFVENKIYLLNKCLDITRELLGAGDNTDVITPLVEQRGLVLKTLDELGTTTDPAVISACRQDQKDAMNRLVTLLIDLDKELLRNLRSHRSKMAESIRDNVQSKKVLNYAGLDALSSGAILDMKK